MLLINPFHPYSSYVSKAPRVFTWFPGSGDRHDKIAFTSEKFEFNKLNDTHFQPTGIFVSNKDALLELIIIGFSGAPCILFNSKS